MARILLLAFFVLVLTHCARYSAAWNTGRTDFLAENHIMLVQEKPASLGWRRLSYASELHPEFAGFLESIGEIDCLAESSQGDRHYMILYQLAHRRAYACRSARYSRTAPMQISGPYPISRREYATLSRLKKTTPR